MPQIPEDVLEELERNLLRLRYPLPFDGPVAARRQLDHCPERIVHFRGDPHAGIVVEEGLGEPEGSPRVLQVRHPTTAT